MLEYYYSWRFTIVVMAMVVMNKSLNYWCRIFLWLDNVQYMLFCHSGAACLVLYIRFLWYVWYDMVWYDMIWYDWYDWYDMIWLIWYNMIWYDAWYDMIWRMIWYDMMHDLRWYDAWFAMKSWQTSCQFNLEHKLRRTENVLQGNEMGETETEVCYVKHKEIHKQMFMREVEAWDKKTGNERNDDKCSTVASTRSKHWGISGHNHRGAEGAEIETPRRRGGGMGRGYPPPQPTRRSGGVVSSTSRVRGGAPAKNGFLRIWTLKEGFWRQ